MLREYLDRVYVLLSQCDISLREYVEKLLLSQPKILFGHLPDQSVDEIQFQFDFVLKLGCQLEEVNCKGRFFYLTASKILLECNPIFVSHALSNCFSKEEAYNLDVVIPPRLVRLETILRKEAHLFLVNRHPAFD
jgi:hypothetical protein